MKLLEEIKEIIAEAVEFDYHHHAMHALKTIKSKIDSHHRQEEALKSDKINTDNKVFVSNLKHWISNSTLTQKQIAKGIGVSPSWFSSCLTGLNGRNFSENHKYKIKQFINSDKNDK